MGSPARGRVPAIAIFVAFAVWACSSSATPAPSAAPGSTAPSTAAGPASVALTIYGAASLSSALDKVTAAYAASHPGTTFTVSTDSSSALATQIEQGAPADVFLSADTTNPQKLVDGGSAMGPVTTFAGNRLAVIVPSANPAGIGSPADLAKPGVTIIAAGEAVPITEYATKLVQNLAELPGYPADFASKYTANIASREDNVAAVVAKVGLGEGDAGIVYATDAAGRSDVTTIPVPEAANVSATYGGVVVKASPNQAAAAAFLDWLAGPGGQAVLGELGFLPPP